MGLCPKALHLLPEIGKLLSCALSRIFFGKDKAGSLCRSGSSGPDLIRKVLLVGDPYLLSGKSLLQGICLQAGDAFSVEAENASGRKGGYDVIVHIRHSGLSLLHQGDTAILQLIAGLDEVASVGPEGRLLLRDHQLSCRACKACQLGDLPVVCSHIF